MVGTRPVLVDLLPGTEGWDAVINDNHDVISRKPFPLAEAATEGDTEFQSIEELEADFPAAEYRNCLCVVRNELVASNGALWKYVYSGRGFNATLQTQSLILENMPNNIYWTDAGTSGTLTLNLPAYSANVEIGRRWYVWTTRWFLDSDKNIVVDSPSGNVFINTVSNGTVTFNDATGLGVMIQCVEDTGSNSYYIATLLHV